MIPPRTAPAAPRRRSNLSRGVAKWTFHAHLWLGIAFTGVVLLVSVTGVLLNHKRSLGLMPDPAHVASGTLEDALSIAALVSLAEGAVPPAVAATGVDRMDVRPGDGLIKVRFDDRVVTEVTLDLASGAVVHVGERNDVFLEKLHSGEIFGDGWVLLSDAAAVALGLLVISGYWIWLYPRSRL